MSQPIHTATIKLHESLIRLVKGAIKAWEDWLEARKPTD